MKTQQDYERPFLEAARWLKASRIALQKLQTERPWDHVRILVAATMNEVIETDCLEKAKAIGLERLA